MKIFVGFLIVLIFVQNLFASTLIFKGAKVVADASASNFVEVVRLNVSKYKAIRIALVRRNLITREVEETRGFRLYGIEDDENVFLNYYEGYSAVIEAPPAEIKISVADKGNYKIYIWGN